MRLWASIAWIAWIALPAALALPGPARAAFHLMEIEQVIGGVNGDTSAQAVQLKMRFAGQNLLVPFAKLVVYDAGGVNPVILETFVANPASGACREILLATADFAALTDNPLAAPDYVMDNKIPASYLAAGSLTFEQIGNATPWWRVSWGGAGPGGYTGAHTVVAGISGNANDLDGNASPAFAGPLPSTALQALKFGPACNTQSLTNAADYALTPGAAVFRKNDLVTTFTVVAPPPPVPIFPGSAGLALVVALGALAAGAAVLRRRVA